MASTQLNFDLDEEEERGTLGAPVFGSPPARLHDKRLDFSQVTTSQFGISTQSFVPSSQSKDKSRVNQLKGRRRSTIGARGSPETNELIRYIAQQRLKTPPSTPGQTPTVTPLHRSPFSHGLSSLKQKMASFQSLLEEEENQRPAGEGKADERATLVREKENRSPQGNPVPAAPPSSKKRRTGPSRLVIKETREAACSAVDTLSSLLTPVCPKQMDVRQAGSEESSCTEMRGCGTEEAVCPSPFRSPGPRSYGCKKVSFPPTYSTPEGPRTRFSQYLSPCMPLTLGPVDSTGNEPLSLPSALRQTSRPAAAGEVPEKAGNSEQPKKKRVHFGVPLSPEFFDKRLPPSTPLQKGGTPAHLSGSGGSRLRSLLKTPQRSLLSLPQPDFNSPSLSGPSSPPPSACQSNEMQAASTEEQEQISVSVGVTDPVDGKEASGSVCSPDVAPPAREETTRREAGWPDATPEPPGALPGEVERGAEPMNQLSPGPGHTPEPPSSTAGPARPRGRKRKQVAETDSAAARRPSRNAAISASGKMKGSAGKRRWGNKAVDRSLYGKRDFASKNPGLSPITETLSSSSRSPTPERRRASGHRAEDSREVCDPCMPLVQTMADVISAASLWRGRFGDPSFEQEVNSRPEDCPEGEATGGDAPYEPDALPDGCEGQRGGRRGRGRPKRASRGKGRGRGVLGQRDHDQTPISEELELQMGCPDVGNSALGDQREGDCRLSNQQESDHFLSNSQERDCSPGEDQETDCFPGDQVESDCRLSNHQESDCFSIDQQESDSHLSDHQESNGFSSDRPESERFSSYHRESDGVTRERVGLDDARSDLRDGSAPEPEGLYSLPSGGRILSSGSQRSGGAMCRSKGRRSSLYRPRPEGEEHGCGDESAGERTEESRGVEICDTAAGQEGEGRVGVGWPGVVLPAPPHTYKAGETEEALPPWHQVEFSIEDVLQSQPTRGCRSVRRSLRNQSHPDPLASGLAWVPCSPATDRRSVRRRTRGCRSSIHAPPTVAEDPSL